MQQQTTQLETRPDAPRAPTAAELRDWAVYNAGLENETSAESIARKMEDAADHYFAVFDHFRSCGLGYCGKVMVAIYAAGPGMIKASPGIRMAHSAQKLLQTIVIHGTGCLDP